MSDRDTCRGENADGEPCGSPVVGADGYCPAHGPDGEERMRELGRKGGLLAHEEDGEELLNPDELPPLNAHEAAEKWLEIVGRAVASGRLDKGRANAVIRAVEAWLDATAERLAVEEVEALEAQVEELEEQLSEPGW